MEREKGLMTSCIENAKITNTKILDEL